MLRIIYSLFVGGAAALLWAATAGAALAFLDCKVGSTTKPAYAWWITAFCYFTSSILIPVSIVFCYRRLNNLPTEFSIRNFFIPVCLVPALLIGIVYGTIVGGHDFSVVQKVKYGASAAAFCLVFQFGLIFIFKAIDSLV